MDLQHLEEHHGELILFLKEQGYSDNYIQLFQNEIKRILRHKNDNSWNSYRDIYLDYLKTSDSENYLRSKRTIIGALEQFDVFGQFPDGKRRNGLFKRGSYYLLEPEYRELIDFFRQYEKQRGKKETTIRGEALNTASFLFQMQELGAHSLEEISEEAVLSFFVSNEGTLLKSCSYKKNIAAVFKAGLQFKESPCQRILSFLPLLRETRKNIQYLTNYEINALREAAAKEIVSARDRAILLLLLFTGLRGCDIAALTLEAIDWENEKILISQQKTTVPLELPLSAIVGNAIYDYLVEERPVTQEKQIFLSERHPFSPLARGSIGNVVSKLCRIAGIRQAPGDRKGTHLFRHHLASSMLENGVPQPVITQTLGHTAPDSLQPYLQADFVHLKECALSVENFPLAKEVLTV